MKNSSKEAVDIRTYFQEIVEYFVKNRKKMFFFFCVYQVLSVSPGFRNGNQFTGCFCHTYKNRN